MIEKALVCALLVAAPLFAFAQEDPYRPLARLPLGGTLLSLPSPQIPAAGAWEVKFTHRFNQSLIDGSLEDQWHSLFGLDSNADVVFGAAWALRPHTEFSLARSNTNDTVEAAVKYVFLQQAEAVPASVTFRGGVDWRTERNLDDRTSLFAQAIVSKQFGGGKMEVFLLPTFVTKAGRAVTGDTSHALFENAFNVPIAFAYRIKPPLMVIAEIIPPNGDLPDELGGSDIGWSLGVKRAIGGHWFEILLTNNQSTLTDQYVTSTYQGSPLDADDIKLGFNIERRFGRRRR